jgi:hypothetical protein
LRGLAGVGGSFRRPPAGSVRDAVLSRPATSGIGARCCVDAVVELVASRTELQGAGAKLTVEMRVGVPRSRHPFFVAPR